MEICTGVKDKDSLRKYIRAGATEFYCGVIDERWLNKYNYVIPLNRRPWKEANFKSFSELQEAIKIAHDNDCKVFYTLNEHVYNNQQLELIKLQIEKLIVIDIDAIIISDFGLVKFLRSNGYVNEIHMSTGALALNANAAKFYRDELKVDRVVLPRSLSIKEINTIARDVTNIDYEIFVKNEGCTYIDGYCNLIHGVKYLSKDCSVQYNPPCEIHYNVLDISNSTVSSECIKAEKRLNRVISSKSNCGVCGLYLLDRNHIKSLKVVSRDTNEKKIERDILCVKEAIEMCDSIDNFKEYKKIVQAKLCNNIIEKKIIHCYYPEILNI